MRKIRLFHTSFSKLTWSFLLLGMLPLLLLIVLFLEHDKSTMRSVMLDNLTQMNSYVGKNVEDIFHSVDEALGSVYDYSGTEGQLVDILKNTELSAMEKELYVDDVLQHILTQSDYICSLRMVAADGTLYDVFKNQGKTYKTPDEEIFRFNFMDEEDMRSLIVLPAISEGEYTVRSEDYVMDLSRNVMDTSSVEAAVSEPLATLFAGIDIEEIEKNIDRAYALDISKIFIYDEENNGYIFSTDEADYQASGEAFPYAEDFVAAGGRMAAGSGWIIYNPVSDLDCYCVTVVEDAVLTAAAFRNRLFLIVLLVFVLLALLMFYMIFSRRMSEPHTRLKNAMAQVQQGNLDARVDVVHTGDEMEYLCEGFNKMANDLQHNVEEVLLAQIYAKSAELDALKMQIQPHYLYNTLDIIRMTALEEKDEVTADLLEALAVQLRYVIGHHDERITLRQELNMLESYSVITNARYQNRISIQFYVSEADQDLYVLKMILQPIVENAIKHGLREKEGPGTVFIEAHRKKEWLEIVVMDDGLGMDEAQLEKVREALKTQETRNFREGSAAISVGMKNVYDRIVLNCGEEYGYEIASVKGNGTIVTFHLPIWEDDGK